MNLENNVDLIHFINSEKKRMIYLTEGKMFNYFCKCFLKTILEIDKKFKDLDSNIKQFVVIGCNVMFNVFWILLNYTNNLTLTIFLSERSILLFTEFIILSRDPKVNKEMCYVPNISDAMSFAYKKTIGPIDINELSSFTRKNNSIKNGCYIFKIIINYFYSKTDTIDTSLEKYLSSISSDISVKIFKIHKCLENDEYFFIVIKKLSYYFNKNSSKEIIIKFLDYLIELKSSKIKLQKQKISIY